MLRSCHLWHKSTSSTMKTLRKKKKKACTHQQTIYIHLCKSTHRRKEAPMQQQSKTPGYLAPHPPLSTPPSLFATPTKTPHPALRKRSLPKAILHLNLPQPRQRPDLQPRLVRAQLDLHAEMPAPRRQPHEEVAWPKKTAPCLDLLESLLVHGATSVAREDEESPQGPLAGLQAFIQRSRCSPLASPSQR